MYCIKVRFIHILFLFLSLRRHMLVRKIKKVADGTEKKILQPQTYYGAPGLFHTDIMHRYVTRYRRCLVGFKRNLNAQCGH